MIHVLAIITAKPGMRDSILKLFRENLPNVLAEKGCIEYGTTIDAENAPPQQAKLGPDSYAVVEKWETMDALRAHFAAPHMVAYSAKVKDMVANRAIHILSPT